jgi:transposase
MLECGCAFCIYMRKCWQMIREAKFALVELPPLSHVSIY